MIALTGLEGMGFGPLPSARPPNGAGTSFAVLLEDEMGSETLNGSGVARGLRRRDGRSSRVSRWSASSAWYACEECSVDSRAPWCDERCVYGARP
jgi:hypothetical protein